MKSDEKFEVLYYEKIVENFFYLNLKYFYSHSPLPRPLRVKCLIHRFKFLTGNRGVTIWTVVVYLHQDGPVYSWQRSSIRTRSQRRIKTPGSAGSGTLLVRRPLFTISKTISNICRNALAKTRLVTTLDRSSSTIVMVWTKWAASR